MLESFCALLGVVVGLVWTRLAARQLGTLLRQRRHAIAIAATTASRLLPVAGLLAALMLRSPLASIATLAGYWCGRTGWLAYVATGRHREGSGA